MKFQVLPPSRGLVMRTAAAFAKATLADFLAHLAASGVLVDGGAGYDPATLPEGANIEEMTATACRQLVLDALTAAARAYGDGGPQPCGACPTVTAAQALLYFAANVESALTLLGTSKACPFAADGFAPWSPATWADAAAELAAEVAA